MKSIFIDTNIFLHYKLFDQINWLDICSDKECEILISPIVIDELDKHKIKNTRVGKRARSIMQKIEKIYDNQDFIIQKNVFLKIINKKPSLKTYNENGLNFEEQDHRLFASIIEFKNDNPQASIYLVSNDIGPRIRAKQFNIKTIILPEDYLLSPETSELEKKIKKLEQENLLLKSRIPRLTLEFENGNEFLKISRGKKELEKDNIIEKELSNLKSENSYLEYQKTNEKKSKSLIFHTINTLSLTKERIDKYNSELDDYFEEYKDYLNKRMNYEAKRNLSNDIIIYLSNVGNIPAENIDIHLHFPDGFELILFDDFPKPPKKPEPPYLPKSRFDFANMGFNSYLPNFYSNMPSMPETEINKPTIRKSDSYDVDFQRNYLKHNYKTKLDTLAVIYRKFDDKQNFNIDYVISAANMSEIIQGSLNIIFE